MHTVLAMKKWSGDPSTMEVDNAEKNALLPRNVAQEWSPPSAVNFENVEQILYVTRKDYALKYVSHRTGKELWYLKFADIEAYVRCQDTTDSLDKTDERFVPFGPKLEGDGTLPLDCQGSTVVYRVRDQSSLEQLFGSDGLLNAHPGALMPSLPATEHALLLQPPKKLPMTYLTEEGKPMLALPLGERENSGMLSLPKGNANEVYSIVPPEVWAGSHMWYLVVFIATLACIIAVFLYHIRTLAVGIKDNSSKLREVGKVQAVLPKKKKSRKSGSGKYGIGSTKDALENLSIGKVRRQPQLLFSNPVLGGMDGRRIGNMFITNKEIAKGSNGTIVLEGIYNGRPVAVKRLVRGHHDVALKEVRNLMASDCHPNIVRLYGIEYDQDFIYLSLELCTCSLNDLICSYSNGSQNQMVNKSQSRNLFSERSNSVMDNNEKFELWKANGYPSAPLLNIMRDIVSGVFHLHELGIIHRDLKPQNVLIIKQGFARAKLSDMGISKRLPIDVSSLTQNSTGGGSSGWQAPEQLQNERQTRSVDLFTLGCLLFFCLTGGQHPFGDSFERDMNIVKNQKDLFLIENISEAVDLVSRLLDPNPSLRPKAVDVLRHPLFWDAEMRLSFLRDASDRLELEDREIESDLLKALESTYPVALGGKWDVKLDSELVSDIGRYRRYKFDSVRDLLRVIRNKLNHYRELSQEIRAILGQPPEGFYSYFSGRFPRLLIEVYKVICFYCGEEESLSKYFRSKQT